MSKLNTIFRNMKREGYVVSELDKYLAELSTKDNDRAINVNAPSQIGKCMRANYYGRTGIESDNNFLDPRTRRIFDNGHGMHDRIQSYLLNMGLLLMSEVPIRNDTLNIQGHTDGLLKLNSDEVGVLELKSINDNGFSGLKSPKPEHELQALIYLYCLEQRRLYLQELYKTEKSFNSIKSIIERGEYYASLYQHLQTGKRYTREEKIEFQKELHFKADKILFKTYFPIKRVILVYENKNDQNLKEFVVSMDTNSAKENLSYALNYCETLNEYCGAKNNKCIPNREGKNKSDNLCRFCNYKIECWC